MRNRAAPNKFGGWLRVREQKSFTVAFVYILRGTTARYYIGVTDNLARRLNEHERGNNHTTRRLGAPLKLVCTHETATIEAGRVLERRLKRLKNPGLAIAAVRKLNGEFSSPE